MIGAPLPYHSPTHQSPSEGEQLNTDALFFFLSSILDIIAVTDEDHDTFWIHRTKKSSDILMHSLGLIKSLVWLCIFFFQVSCSGKGIFFGAAGEKLREMDVIWQAASIHSCSMELTSWQLQRVKQGIPASPWKLPSLSVLFWAADKT